MKMTVHNRRAAVRRGQARSSAGGSGRRSDTHLLGELATTHWRVHNRILNRTNDVRNRELMQRSPTGV